MEFKCKINNVSFDMDGNVILTLTSADRFAILNQYQQLKDFELTAELKRYRQKRSTNANAYCWTLINKLGNVLKLNKDEVYMLMLKRYGQSELVSILATIDISGYFKYYDVAGSTLLNGKEFTHYRIYKGSSEYDTREMAILIDGIVQECKEQNIETLPPEEIEILKNQWKQ